MKNESLFHKTVNILVQAYLNDTLVPSMCSACAVGNLVAANCGYKIDMDMPLYKGFVRPMWQKLVWSNKEHEVTDETYYQIQSTGYSVDELRQIERAFMNGGYPYDFDENSPDYTLKLYQVVDLLCDIHEMNDTIKEEAKALFVRS